MGNAVQVAERCAVCGREGRFYTEAGREALRGERRYWFADKGPDGRLIIEPERWPYKLRPICRACGRAAAHRDFGSI